ncbi:MAG: TlpA disulfide reductase family protein [Steroidobacteraceae bacterium]
MKRTSKGIALTLLLGAASTPALLAAATPAADAIQGRWDASLNDNGTIIPFRLDISGSGAQLKGTLYDGFSPYDGTTSASFKDGKLVLNIEHYLTTITATLQDGQLVGNVSTTSRTASSAYGFQATRHVEAASTGPKAPSIAGSWEIPLSAPSAKGEKAFRFIVQQQGNEISASILRVDGDTGAYTGSFQDGKWLLSHFDGSRPGVIQVTPQADGTLEVLQHNEAVVRAAQGNSYGSEATTNSRYDAKLVAYRTEVARAKGLPEPANYLTHTTARDPKEKFTFSFPDDHGKLVTQEDPRFKGKVVLAIVTGTWCPNCHDEAQYLVELDKKYRDKGLAIVALDFEEPEQQDSLAREKAFVQKYGVKYTYLIAGAPAEMWEKVPQLVNLNTWPATVFVGRDGLVKAVHSGFASPASGEFHEQLKRDFTARIEQLLAEKAPAAVADAGNSSTTLKVASSR